MSRCCDGSAIQAGAPLFIPGVGAPHHAEETLTDPITDARIGLGGPVWGLARPSPHGSPYSGEQARRFWLAITELTGFINLFNLIPIWQLDGSRGFHALSRQERWIVLAVIGVALWLTGVGVLWLVAGVALFRTLQAKRGPATSRHCSHSPASVLSLSWFARLVVTQT
jgi:Zn-dependent protease